MAKRTPPSQHSADSATPPLVTLPPNSVYSIKDVIERSEFITYLYRTDNEDEARAFIDSIKHKHATATHNCSAFLIDQPGSTPLERSSDDGEPAGTAGAPMLNALKHSGLTCLTAVVTRYFGGIKLGTGGLVDAYFSAVERACLEAPKLRRTPAHEVSIAADPSMAGKLDGYLRNRGFSVVETVWGPKPSLRLIVQPQDLERLENLVAQLTSGTSAIDLLGDVMLDEPIN